MFLHRYSVKPRHLEAWQELWPQFVALRTRHGFTTHRGFLETPAEPKVTWLYAHADPSSGRKELARDRDYQDLVERAAPHVFRNVKVRPVRVEIMSDDVSARLAVMRRYSIVGDWSQFLQIWREIVPVREQYGFHCLFAVADEPENMFTWAFDFDGTWEDFPAAQRDYYRDPARVRLRGVFDYMADYQLSPAQQLTISRQP